MRGKVHSAGFSPHLYGISTELCSSFRDKAGIIGKISKDYQTQGMYEMMKHIQKYYANINICVFDFNDGKDNKIYVK